MVISERLKPANLPLSVKGARLAVIGTAASSPMTASSTVGNLNLFIATVSWAIVDKDILVNIPVRPIERFQLALSAMNLSTSASASSWRARHRRPARPRCLLDEAKLKGSKADN